MAIFSAEETNPNEIIPLASVYNVGQELYGFGYLGKQESGRYTILKHTGSTIHNQTEIIILNGQIFPGFSGSLVFNPITETICGMITATRSSNNIVIEAYAISAITLEKCIKEILPKFKTPSINEVERDVLNFATKPVESLDEDSVVAVKKSLEIETALEKVEGYIEDFKIEEAIRELKEISSNQTNRNDLIIIKSKYMNLKRNKNLGFMNFEQIRIEQSQILQGLIMVMGNIRELE